MPKKRSIFASFWKPEACGQTVLPDRSVLRVVKWQQISSDRNHGF